MFHLILRGMVPELASLPEFQWIKHRKIIYIPKKQPAISPSDDRPLSMREVLYKIPARILSARLSNILPTIKGSHQHGFMRGRGVQEPSLIATHIIQEAEKHNIPVQLISLDIEKAFDKVLHTVIKQSPTAFGLPQAITNLALIGFAQVEVKKQKSLVFKIGIGSGQGTPFSSPIFLIATEPLNLALTKLFSHIQYATRQGISTDPSIYADDNPTGYQLQRVTDLIPV